LSFRSSPSRLERYVLGESILPFFLGFGLVTFLFVIDFLFDYLELLLAKGVPAMAVGELFLLALGWITALSVPCGVLVGALMSFGRMAQDNEVTAMRALGVNVAQVLRTPIMAGLVVTGLMILFNNFVLPETNHRFACLMTAIHRKSPTARIVPGVFIDDFDNYSLLVRQLDDRTGEMRDITIYDYTQGTTPTTILAEKGHMRFLDGGATLELDLEDGEIHEVPGERAEGKYRRLFFDRQTLRLNNPGAVLQRTDRQGRSEREMNLADLREQIDRLDSQIGARRERLEEKAVEAGFPSYAAFEAERGAPGGVQRLWRKVLGRAPQAPDTTGLGASERKALEAVQVERLEIENLRRRIDNYDVEIHKKFSIPFACVVFVLLGGPLGIRMRRGGFANMAVSVVFFMVYYLFLIGGEQFADRRLMAPWLAMWLPNIVLGSLGIYLTASVTGLGPSRGMR